MNKTDYERELTKQGCSFVAGMDEAGRGPLAGPVVVAAVLMPLTEFIDGVDDSKKLSPKKREFLYEEILKHALEYSVAVIDENVIDEINILNATKKGMTECASKLCLADGIVIDAVKLSLPVRTLSVIHGDELSYSVAAASIIAKVTRDRIMCGYDAKFPEYGFKHHKGYGTAEHISALKKYGPCEIHRRTFISHFTDAAI